jgi:hypothetical protein
MDRPTPGGSRGKKSRVTQALEEEKQKDNARGRKMYLVRFGTLVLFW